MFDQRSIAWLIAQMPPGPILQSLAASEKSEPTLPGKRRFARVRWQNRSNAELGSSSGGGPC